MDAALGPFVAEDEPPADGLDLSPEGIERERRRWVLINPDHLDLYVLWRRLAGMGGEGLGDLLRIAGEPGSAALFHDFNVLSAREKRLKKQGEFFKR
jgi:hypothetical protein